MSNATIFGSELDVLHEMVITGREVGADADFYGALAAQPALFRQVVQIVRKRPQPPPEAEFPKIAALRDALDRGVVREPELGGYRFADPGLSVLEMSELPEARTCGMFNLYNSDVPLAQHPWAHTKDEPCQRVIAVPLANSFDKRLSLQKGLLARAYHWASARQVITFLLLHAMATGERLLNKCYVRCPDQAANGWHINVGAFHGCQINVGPAAHNNASGAIGMAAIRR